MNTILEQINFAGMKFVEFALPMLVQSVVLILILLLIDLALRNKLRAVFRYWIWLLVLVKFVLPTSLTSPLSLGYLIGDRLEYVDKVEINSKPKAQLADASTVNIPLYIDLSNIRSERFALSATPIIPNTKPITGQVIAKVEPEPVKSAKASPPVTPLSWQAVVFLLWLAAVMAMSLLLLQRAFLVKGLLRQACPANNLMTEALEYCQERMKVKRNVRLKVSFNATSPAVCGLFRPVILLPQNLGPTLGSSHLRTVIMHELAHIKRGDLWINTLQVVLQIFYLYNPLLWLANSMIRRIREQAVDETVLVAMGPKAQQYPETLLNVARLAWQRPALSLRLIGVIESKSQLKERIKKMLERPAPKSAKLGIAGILLIIALGAFLLPMANAKNSEAGTSKVSEELKAEKQAEIEMLLDKIKQLEKHLMSLQKQVSQKKSQIAVVETKAKEQSNLIKKDKQKVEEKSKTAKEKAKAAREKAEAAREKAKSIEALKKLELILKKMEQEEPQISELEQLKQLELLLQKVRKDKQQKIKEKEATKELDKAEKLAKVMEDIEAIKKDAAHMHEVVVAPALEPTPVPEPEPIIEPVPEIIPVAPVTPAPHKLPKLPKLPKIVPPPIREIPVDGESIKIVAPRIEPPKEIIEQISKVHTEKAALEQQIQKLRMEFDKRREHGDFSDEEAEEWEQKIEALEHKHEMLEESAEALEERLEAWSEQVREQVADRYEKIRDQVRQKVEVRHEDQRKQYEQQRQQFERAREQYERLHKEEFEGQVREFEQQMQQLDRQREQLERQKEQLERQKEQLERQKENEHERELEQLGREMEQIDQQFEHEHEKEFEQLEHQMEQFGRQMEQWAEQHQHSVEQWSQQYNKDFEVSVEGLEDELDNIDVKVDVEVDANEDADANTDVVVDVSKEGAEKANFTKGPNILTTPLAPGRKILVKNRIGSINVSSGKAGQCTCSITVKTSAETMEQARQKAKPVKIEVDDDNEALNLVVVKTDNDEWEGVNVDLNIQVPPGSDILVNNEVGNIRMINLEGKIQGRTKVGDILATNLNGNIMLLTDVGKVVYEVPAEISAEVTGSTDFGKIKTELSLDVIKNFQKSQISGLLGKGENKVDLKTKVGDITIRKAKPLVPEDKPLN